MYLCSKNSNFFGEELLAFRPNPKLEDHFLSSVRDCLFNIFAATLQIGGRFSTRNLGRSMPWWQGPFYHLATATHWLLLYTDPCA